MSFRLAFDQLVSFHFELVSFRYWIVSFRFWLVSFQVEFYIYAIVDSEFLKRIMKFTYATVDRTESKVSVFSIPDFR